MRRLGCPSCGRVHHELSDILVPYKRYGSKSIEFVVGGSADITVAADESTINRWRNWFSSLAEHFVGCLASIGIRFCKKSAEGLPTMQTISAEQILF
jgi:hypothetical protein